MFPHLKERPNRRGSATVSRLPALFILGCFASVVGYVSTLTLSVHTLSTEQPFNEFLQIADQTWVAIPYQILLFAFYLGIFLCAMGAFVLMAIKEFLQDTLGITERDLLTPKDTTPPKVTSTNPPDQAGDVPPDIHLTAAFSKDMDETTINPGTFKLLDVVDLAQVAGGVAYDVTARVATLIPATPLQNGRIYAVTITARVQDQAENALVQDHTWHFTVIP
jgi:hypothetical protein